MSNQEPEPQSSNAIQTPRPRSGTQPRQSYSLAELGTPSGEVVFNFGRRNHGDVAEAQVDLPLGRNSPRLPSTREVWERSGKTPWSSRLGTLQEMLESVGTLRNEIVAEMATSTAGSSRETSTRSVAVGEGCRQPTGGDKTSWTSSPSRRRVVGHAGSEIPPLLTGEAEDSCGPAGIPATGRGYLQSSRFNKAYRIGVRTVKFMHLPRSQAPWTQRCNTQIVG